MDLFKFIVATCEECGDKFETSAGNEYFAIKLLCPKCKEKSANDSKKQ